jgi:hypothetical protein
MGYWDEAKVDTDTGGDYWAKAQVQPPEQPSLMRRALTKAGDIAGQVGSGIRAGMDVASGLPAESSMTGKNMPPLSEGSDPLALASQHPYVTAAATGAALGPTVPLLAAIGETSPLLSSGLGALEQLGYQGISDTSQKIAGPNHPILGAIPGMVAPFVAPGAIERGLGTKQMKDAIEGAAEKSRSAVQSVADGAATRQEAKNLLEQTKLSESAQKGLTDFNDKIEAHAKDIYAKGEAAKPEVAESTRAGAAKQDAAITAQENERLAQQAEAQRGQVLGRTKAETAAAIRPAPATPEAGVAVASPEELTRKHAFRSAIFGERDRTADYLGKKLDDFEKAHGAAEIPDPKPLKATLTEVEPRLREAGEPMEASKPINKLLAQAKGLTGEVTGEPRYRDVSVRDKVRYLDPANLNEKKVIDQMRAMGVKPEVAAEGGGAATVAKMRDLRRAAQKVAGSSVSDSEKDIASDIADAADRSLEHAKGVSPEAIEDLRNTNKHWRDFKETYKSAFLSHVSNEPEPVKVAKDIFDVPKRGERLLTAATPEERTVYRNLMADWMNEENVPLHEIPAKIGEDNLRRLGFDPVKFKAFEPRLNELKETIAKSPTVAKWINQGVRERMGEIHADMGDKLRKETIQLARQLGPAGKQIETAARNALTPMDVQKVAGQLAQMKPEDFVKALASQQMSGPDAALRAVSKVPLKSDAARQALLNMKPGRIESYAGRFLAFHTLYWGLRSMDGLITGAGGLHGVIGMAALDALAGGYMGLRATGRAMLKKPELFEKMYQAVSTPAKMGGYQKTGRAIAEVLNGVAAINAKTMADKADKMKHPDTGEAAAP